MFYMNTNIDDITLLPHLILILLYNYSLTIIIKVFNVKKYNTKILYVYSYICNRKIII